MSEPHYQRVRGGVEYDGLAGRWRPIIHVWHTAEGQGPPAQVYQWNTTYATEAEAVAAYTTVARPALEAMLAEIRRTPGASAQVHRWGFTHEEETR